MVKTINEPFYNCLKEIEKEEISVLHYRYAEENELVYDLVTKLLTGDGYKGFRMGFRRVYGLDRQPSNTVRTKYPIH